MLGKTLKEISGDIHKADSLIEFGDVESIKQRLVTTLVHTVGKDPLYATVNDWFYALAFLLRGILSERYINSARDQFKNDTRRVYYLSMEYLLGRSLIKNLHDLDLFDITEKALEELGLDLDALAEIEHDPGLGNGGLGRLAACFLESMVTHDYPGFGYGLRYDFGLFSQTIEKGQQVEHPDNWLRHGNQWEFERPDVVYPVQFHGNSYCFEGDGGRQTCQWVDTDKVVAMAYDFPIAGYGNGKVTNLRLWVAQSTDDFDLGYFNKGDYIKSVEAKTASETLSKILYPDDSTLMGQELRLKQEYFFVSASIQDILARFLRTHETLDGLPEKIVIQLNDTHPALGIAELMRLLVDIHGYDWEKAWDMTTRIFAYTNHTLLPEALERWPVDMLQSLLPRHLQIILDINERLLVRVENEFPGDADKLQALSFVEDHSQTIRMAHLAIVGSSRVNGVAALHTKLLRENVFPDFDRMYPDKFVNVTNGVTQRRWLLQANPGLAALISEHIGDGWTTDLSRLEELAPLAGDAAFRERFRDVKTANKRRLAKLIDKELGIVVPDGAIFDVQIKRIHEYKRQLLNLLHILTRYNRIRNGWEPKVPRVAIFAGKAAPGYFFAKLIIRLIHDVGRMINSDPAVGDLLKVAFIPNYGTSIAEIIIPGSDLSEQISTAGTEASGTGNMKFAMNGALTLGTLDGANIEIRDAVGDDNIFIFGLIAEEVAKMKTEGYNPWESYQNNPELRHIVDLIRDGFVSPEEPDRYRGIYHSLIDHGDPYMLLADYEAYVACQEHIDSAFLDQEEWTRKAVLNVAAMGPFSADRAVHEYARNIWNIKPLKS